MPPLFTVVGADVLFAHWRVDPDAVAAALPPDPTVDTFDGSAWVSALALENRSVSPDSRRRWTARCRSRTSEPTPPATATPASSGSRSAARGCD
jgi:uncharacterized protein YqjF (DUF2071 family)